MDTLRESAVYALVFTAAARVDGAARRSMLGAWLGALWRWLGRQYDRSLLRLILRWESVLDRKLRESVFGSLADLLLGLPDRIEVLEGEEVKGYLKEKAGYILNDKTL